MRKQEGKREGKRKKERKKERKWKQFEEAEGEERQEKYDGNTERKQKQVVNKKADIRE